MDNKRHGHWVESWPNGHFQEGLFVDDKRNGYWAVREPSGDTYGMRFVHGNQFKGRRTKPTFELERRAQAELKRQANRERQAQAERERQARAERERQAQAERERQRAAEEDAQPAPDPIRSMAADLAELERSLSLSFDQRVNIQRALNAMGLNAGGADGIFGPRTRRAIVESRSNP